LFVVNSGSRHAFDAATEEAKLLRRDSEWAEAASSGKDIEKILSYWTDDALLIFPGQPILEGKAAIRPYVASSVNIPGFKIRWVSSKAVFSSDGKMAYMPATTEITAPGPDGALITKQLRAIISGGSSLMASGAVWWILRMSNRRPRHRQGVLVEMGTSFRRWRQDQVTTATAPQSVLISVIRGCI
jgi:ketosteroid isomerase-like protein